MRCPLRALALTASMLGASMLGASLSQGCGVSTRGRAVTALHAEVMRGVSVCPGTWAPLRVIAETAEGERLVTRGPARGRVRWEDYAVRIFGGHLEDGHVVVGQDPGEYWAEQRVRVEIRSRHHPAFEPLALELPMSYACQFRLERRGADGGRGGFAGGLGRRGEDGADGPALWAVVTRVRGSVRPLLAVSAGEYDSLGHLYVVDPAGGSLTLASLGGDGGDGRRGGPEDEAPRGSGGAGGRGGSVLVLATPDARPYLGALRFDNQGGRGGHGSPRGPDGPPGPSPRIELVRALPRGTVQLRMPRGLSVTARPRASSRRRAGASRTGAPRGSSRGRGAERRARPSPAARLAVP